MSLFLPFQVSLEIGLQLMKSLTWYEYVFLSEDMTKSKQKQVTKQIHNSGMVPTKVSVKTSVRARDPKGMIAVIRQENRNKRSQDKSRQRNGSR